MAEAIYHIENLSQMYEERTVLEIEKLKIYTGEILSIVGPSGAGKSTLLRHLNFLESPTTGRVIFQGKSYHNGASPRLETRRKVTTVFQHPVLLSRSVTANIAYGLKVRGQRSRLIDRRVSEALHRVGLDHLAKAAARTLSGGEAQRVALARALVIEPAVLLMDEPTANLDPYNIKIIEEIIRELNEEQKTTIVLVTHNIFQAKRLAHRTALILEGQLVEIADTPDFFNNPADSRTAAFVQGDMVY